MNTTSRTPLTRFFRLKPGTVWTVIALSLTTAITEGATPIITAPPGNLQVDVGDTLTFSAATVTTFAGQDTNGYTDGTGTAAQFSVDPHGIDFDVGGNVYITDTSNHRIRKITPAGVVTTHVGDGTAGAVNGAGVSAQVNSPKDLIYTNSGTIYFADSGNNRIRQFDAGANVSNFVGKATAGDAVGKEAHIKFDHPISIAYDEANSYMYVMDKNNFKIKKIDLNLSTNSNSFCTEFVGDGTEGHNDATGTSARISYGGIDLDSSGNLYLADTTNHCIRKITPAGVVTTLAGSAGNSGDAEGSGTTARFSSPVDLTIDEDDFIYVADSGNNKIKRVTPGGVAMDLAGTGTSAVTDGSLFTAEFVSPISVGFFDDNMYVTQNGNGRIREMLRPDHFWVTDTDSATVSVTLTADNGVLTIDLSQGGTITGGSNGSATFTVQGLLDQLNRAFSTLEYDHDMGFTGTDTITYSATDGTNTTPDATVDVLVQTNNPPTISSIANESLANHGSDADIDFTVSDTDGDAFTVTYAKHFGDAAVTLTDNGGGNWNIFVNPDNGFSGVISISIYAEDVWDAETEEQFFVYVNYTPQAPVLDPIGNQTTDEDVTLNLTLSATDGNGDPLTYSAVVNSGNVTANVSGTSLDLIPDPDWFGTANITVTVDDGYGSTDSETFDLTVNPVNDPPTTSDNTVTGNEDEVFVFATFHFPYSDPESDPLSKVRLQAASAGTFWVDTDGSLALDNGEVAVFNNDEVSAANIAKLSFLPDANDNGTAYATFLFEVNDGTSYSSQQTMTLDILAVNDAPITSDNTVTATEDTVFTFGAGDFPYSDVESDPLNKIRLQAATAGTLWVDADGSGALDNGEVAVANNDEVAAADITKLKFLANLNDNGVAYSTFGFEVHDGALYSTQQTITIDVTAVNDAPTTADNTVTATEDTVFTFGAGDFPYTDVDSDPLNKVRLQAATAGTLWVDADGSGALDNGEVAVANNDEVAAADITKLKFLADLNDNGLAYATFDFEVHDGALYSTQETITIDVTAVNDAPTSGDNTVTAIEDTAFTFGAGDFPYSDVESDPLNKVRLQAASAGTLWVDADGSGALDNGEVAVANNDEVAVADLTKLKFLADLNDNGTAYATFLFEVNDGTDYSSQQTMTIDVTAVNDAPTTSDNTVTAIEDTVFTYGAGDFPYSDVESDPLNKIRLQAATAGTLWVDADGSGALDNGEVAVANNDEVATADIAKLKFLADLNDNGTAYSTFLFEVNDGADYSTQQTITIDVTAVNDAPTSADNTFVALEDTVFIFGAGDFPYTDVDSDPLNKVRLQAATAGTLWVDADGSGALDNGEVAVANNDEVAAADITKLKFLADLNDNGVAYSTFDFEVNDGTDYSTQETITIDVTAVNDAPVTSDNTVTAIEDTVFTFGAGDFPYSDVESDPLNKIRLQAATAGTLWVDADGSGALDNGEVAVANNDEVVAADITKLKFLADLNDNGVAYSTFDFEVNDGTDYSTQETITIDVTAVNDAPVTSDNTVTAIEDTVFIFGAGDFPYSDVESDPLNKIRLQAATAGTLWVDADGSGALDNGEVAVANNDEVVAADITKLKFLADLNDNGVAYSTFDFEVNDGTDYSTQETITIDVTAVNDAPTSADNTVTAIEDTVFTLGAGDFPYTDVESDPLDKVRLQAASAGTLWVDADGSGALDNGEVAVANNDEVAAADITKLKFLADLNDNGLAYSTFLFEVNDGALYSTQHTMTIDVTAVNDAPTSADNTVTAIEDTVFTFGAGDFPYTDVESNPLDKVRLQAATAGTLWVDADGSGALDNGEVAVANNDEVAAADITKLKFLADLNDNGLAYSTFLFEVNDGALYSAQHTMTIDVTAVNDAPTSADNTVTAIEDTVFTFGAGDFPYTDVESDPLDKVRLQAATAGTLWVDADGSGAMDNGEVAVANNDEVAAADITKLKFLADPDDNGTAYSTFLFEVNDGALYSAQHTMTIDVTAVNDAPTSADNTVTAIEDTVFTFGAGDFPYTDVDGDPLNKVRLQAATAGTLWVDTDGSGALDNGEVAVANNDEVAAADIAKLKFLADLNDNGVAYSTFLFEVNDGTDYSTQHTMTIDVTAVNDAPTSANNTITALEDTVYIFSAGDFPYTDVDSDPLDKVRLQAATAGTLWVDADGSGSLDNGEVAVANNDEVAAADISKLKFLADLNDNGIAYSTFLFEVNDGTVYSSQHTMTIDVTAVNDTPTDITLDNDTIIEAKPIGTIVGNFSATDVDAGETFTYSLVAGAGDTGNGSFSISGNQLQSAVIFNYATQNTYSIRVRVTDSGTATYEEIFTITIEQGGSLTINIIPPAGGTTTGEGDYTPGDTAIATATANSGYIFAGWTGDVPGGANATDTPLSILIDSNKTLNAYFTREFHNVSVSVFPERHGYATGGGAVLDGTSITLTATELAAPDTVPFSHWRINGVDGSTNPSLVLTVNDTISVEAVFDMGLPSEYVLVPAVDYTREKNNRNEHVAKVSAFYMSSNETTKLDWYTVYNWAILNGYTFEFDPINANGNNLPHTDAQYLDDFPITGIYWNDMLKWCNARSEMEGFTPSYYTNTGKTTVHRTVVFADESESLTNNMVDWRNRGYRLPTEAEWEAAARGGYENYNYPNGNQISDQFAHYNQSTEGLAITSATLHSRDPNGLGLYDMAGNAWEACWDWWSKDWYQNPLCTLLDTPGPTLAQTNLDNNFRALRGGSGHSVAKWVSVKARFYSRDWLKYPITLRPVFPAPGTPDVSLTVATEQGSFGTALGSGVYETGSSVTLQATPEGTATFVEWQDENGTQLSTNATFVYTASTDSKVMAVFQDTPLPGITLYTLTSGVYPVGSGIVSGQGTYVAGSEVQLTATPSDGKTFVGWYEDAFGTTSPKTITLNQNMMVSAAFDNEVMSMDSDTDGLMDFYETVIGSDPYSRDSDGDHISDGLEIDTYTSNPISSDSDGDGHEDSVEYYYNTSLNGAGDYPFFPKDGLVRHFPFSGGLALDISPNSTHGSITDTTNTTDRFSDVSEAFSFNGTSSFVNVNGFNGVTGSDARSFSAWVRTAPANSGPILAYGTGVNAFSVNIGTGGIIEILADAATLTGTTNLTDNNWHHVIVTVPAGGAPGDITVVINGASESLSPSGDTVTTLATASSSPVQIGTNSIGQFFTGDLDEIRLYDRQLLSFETAALYTLEASPQPTEVPVAITTQPVTSIVALGDSISLTFTATGTPTPIYQWQAQYEGQWHYIEGENTTSLTFASATDYDSRAYRAMVIDVDGDITYTKNARLYVLHPPTLADPEPDLSFIVNVGGKISAGVDGSTPMTYEWFKDGISLGTSTRNGYLIPNTASQATHGGAYHYTATNSVGALVSNTFTVSIIDPITITTQPVNTGIIVGDNGSLSVAATGGGTIQYQWLKYDSATRKRTEVEGATSPTFSITSMDASQEGIYGCRITNGPSTRYSKFVLLTMYIPPVFTTHPANVIQNEYGFVQLDSMATGVPNPTYQWEKYNTMTTSWEPVNNFTKSFLRYKTVIADMAGTYRSVATNAAGTATSNSAIITVYYKPVITTNIANITANEDDDVTFTVNAHALDATGTAITYQWFFNNIPLADGPGVSGSTTNSLTISTVNKTDDYGTYYCTMTNALGVTQSRIAKLYIIDKPYALTTLVDQTINEGQKLYLWVYVRGTLPLTMQWYKDGVPIPGAIYTKYIISAVTPGDAGLYSFIVSNPAGSLQQDANITITSASTASAGSKVLDADTSDPYGDPDGDGLNNLLEEAVGSDPKDPNSTYFPNIEIVDGGAGQLYASINYSTSKTAEGVSVILQQSSDLQSWQPVDLSKATITNLDRPTYQETTIYLPIENANLFFRLQATK